MPIALGCFEQLEEQRLHVLALVRLMASPMARGTVREEARGVVRNGVSDGRVGGVSVAGIDEPLEVVRDAEGEPPLGDSRAGHGGRDRGEAGFFRGFLGGGRVRGLAGAWSGSLHLEVFPARLDMPARYGYSRPPSTDIMHALPSRITLRPFDSRHPETAQDAILAIRRRGRDRSVVLRLLQRHTATVGRSGRNTIVRLTITRVHVVLRLSPRLLQYIVVVYIHIMSD